MKTGQKVAYYLLRNMTLNKQSQTAPELILLNGCTFFKTKHYETYY